MPRCAGPPFLPFLKLAVLTSAIAVCGESDSYARLRWRRNAVIEGKDADIAAGTTTLIGGLCLEIDLSPDNEPEDDTNTK